MIPIGLLLIIALVTACLVAGAVIGEYTVDGLKNQTAFCVNECPNEDIGPSQVVLTPGWKCNVPSSISGDCVPIPIQNATHHHNTANILLWKGACKLTGLSPSLCMKGLHELVPNIGNVTNSTKESCYWPGDFPSYPGEPCCAYDGAAGLCDND